MGETFLYEPVIITVIVEKKKEGRVYRHRVGRERMASGRREREKETGD